MSQEQSYVLFTDSSCDITPELLDAWDVRWCSLACIKDDVPQTGFEGSEGIKAFYQHMREGDVFKTSAVTPGEFVEAFGAALAEGKDVLYLGFSSGLSATVDSAQQAANLLHEQYPERRILIVDTLCASSGQGLLVYLAVQKRDAGATIDELRDYVEEEKPHITHLFTVDDLVYLKRGGRVSGASAQIATVLNIKPVMHVDDEGHLIAIAKVRGRKKAIAEIVKRYKELALHPETGPVFVSHGDCIDDVHVLGKSLHDECGIDFDCINYVGPVIGAHSGPGTLAFFFEGTHR